MFVDVHVHGCICARCATSRLKEVGTVCIHTCTGGACRKQTRKSVFLRKPRPVDGWAPGMIVEVGSRSIDACARAELPLEREVRFVCTDTRTGTRIFNEYVCDANASKRCDFHPPHSGRFCAIRFPMQRFGIRCSPSSAPTRAAHASPVLPLHARHRDSNTHTHAHVPHPDPCTSLAAQHARARDRTHFRRRTLHSTLRTCAESLWL